MSTRVRVAALLLLVVMAGGCIARQLRKQSTVGYKEITDLHYHQVLDNIARYHAEPGSLPSFAVLDAANTQLQDSGSVSACPFFNFIGVDSLSLSVQGTRTLTHALDAAPVKDPYRLMRMRRAFELLVHGYDLSIVCVLRKEADPHAVSRRWSFATATEVTGRPEDPVADLVGYGLLDGPEPATVSEALYFYEDTDATNYAGRLTRSLHRHVPRGWYGVTCRKLDVPADALYVGEYDGVYAWVGPCGLDGLSRFTATVLTLAQYETLRNEVTVALRLDAAGRVEGETIEGRQTLDLAAARGGPGRYAPAAGPSLRPDDGFGPTPAYPPSANPAPSPAPGQPARRGILVTPTGTTTGRPGGGRPATGTRAGGSSATAGHPPAASGGPFAFCGGM